MADVVDTPPEGEEPVVPEPVAEIASDDPDAVVIAQANKPDAVARALEAEREKRRKALSERDAAVARLQAVKKTEARMKEWEDSQKSEEQRREEALNAERARAEAAEARAKELEHRELQREVAIAQGIPLSAAHRLVGGTLEELTADAEQFKTQVTSPEQVPPPGDGGARTPVTPKDLNEQIREAEAAGDYVKAMDLKALKLVGPKS